MRKCECMSENNDLSMLIERVILIAFEEIEKNKDILKPTFIDCMKATYHDLIHITSYTNVKKEDWRHAINITLNLIGDREDYSNVKADLEKLLARKEDVGLHVFLQKIIEKILKDNLTKENDFSDEIKIFINDLKRKDVEHNVDISFSNLVIPKDINISIEKENIELAFRKTRKEDIENELVPFDIYEMSTPTEYFNAPKSFLHITFYSHPANYIAFCSQLPDDTIIYSHPANYITQSIRKIITIINLYKNWGIGIGYYRMKSQSCCYPINENRINKNEYSASEGVLEEDEIDDFKEFIRIMYDVLPKEYYDNNTNEFNITNTLIAFKRYYEALFSRDMIERIYLGISGLEGLLSDNGELTYKLSMRTAKLLRYFDFDPLNVRGVVKKSYGIRSNFVHGSPMPMSIEKKQTLSEDYGGDISLLLLDYLRIILIIYILSKEKKLDLKALIDEAMISDDDNKLKEIIDSIKTEIPTKSLSVTLQHDYIPDYI